ncbi:hypothetical protein [Flavobacterium muglaense]|uniref:Uncharacterized protein n=1 Tax=Flavobacterium muglaense TaxID=2764716 RepID=A0A923MZU8_9FLAO|nr:hypothetical protein [Flavobacterium muglaense]MBC5838197.1 hypothetical protein [Flavobacterium muglaense]MBC5844719.1 hypothetical protein [Flavobacterium muglaense]
MKQVVWIVMMCFAINGYSQSEFSSKFKAIPPVDTSVKIKKTPPPTVAPPDIVAPNILKKPETKFQSTTFKIGDPDPISMIQTNDFINPGDEVRDKMNKSINKSLVNSGLKEDTSYLNQKDLDFGTIRTKSKTLLIRVRDYGAIDGDLIKATSIHDYKSIVLVNNLYLDSGFRDIHMDLKEGLNYLELEALNRGSLGGNTGAFYIYDSAGTLLLSDLWNNFDKGVKSKFTFIKE